MISNAQEFVASLEFVYPIVFESGDDAFPYYCGGTCFAVRLGERLFIVTAKHCLTGREGAPCIMGPDRRFFPIHQTFPLAADEDDNDWADITCISTYPHEHWPALQPNNAVDMDQLRNKRPFTADGRTVLVLKGYPKSHTKINPPNILRTPSLHLGVYGGPTGEKHCHYFNVEHPPIGDPNGLSGSPVVIMDHAKGRGFFPTLLGVVTRGGVGTQFLRFIGVDVVIRLLLQLDEVSS